MYKHLHLVIACFVAMSAAGLIQAREELRTSDVSMAGDALRQQYLQLKDQLQISGNKRFVITSREQDGRIWGEVYALLPYRYNKVSTILKSSDHWCNAVSLHINVKTCAAESSREKKIIHLFIGDEDYLEPEDAYAFQYRYQVQSNEISHYIHVQAIAEDGPLDTQAYTFETEAMAVNQNTSFVHFSYTAELGGLTRTLLNTYFATFGRNKVGFSKQGVDDDGLPIYVKGMQGLMERNVVRYFFAFESYLYALNAQEEQRLELGMNRWYDLTERFPRQLHEVERMEYLETKRKEHKNQQAYQMVLKLPKDQREQDIWGF